MVHVGLMLLPGLVCNSHSIAIQPFIHAEAVAHSTLPRMRQSTEPINRIRRGWTPSTSLRALTTIY